MENLTDAGELAHSPEIFALAIAAAILVDPFSGLQDVQDVASATQEPAPEEADTFDFDAWEARQAAAEAELAAAFAPAAEPGYYLYWYGEGDTSYWLSDQPIPDFNGVLVAGGDALYARFGQLGTYMDMDIALGYGGIRPMDQVHTLHLMDPAEL